MLDQAPSKSVASESLVDAIICKKQATHEQQNTIVHEIFLTTGSLATSCSAAVQMDTTPTSTI